MGLDPFTLLILSKIADKAFDEAIKQGINLAKSAVKGELSHKINFKSGLFLPKSQLINMEKELRAIKQALSEAPNSRLIYICGEGGMGKTRLLEETGKIAQKDSRASLWGGIIDLYHSDYHSTLHLQKVIANNIDPQNLHFKKYRQLQDDMERKQSSGVSIAENLAELEGVFLEDYNKVASLKSIAIAFDTLEKIDDEYDIVQNIGEGFAVSFTVKKWLIRFCAKIKNTTVIMAGRPSPNLQGQFEQEFSQPGRFEVIKLNGLTREDTRQLLKIYSNQEHQISTYLDPYSDVLWQYTKGSPARLAMIVELSEYVSSIIRERRPENVASDKFLQEMVCTFFDYQDPDRRMLFLLALARKGMTFDLLSYLEPSWPLETCSQKIEQLKHLSLIKTRPASQEVFLHDALYDTFDNYITTYSEIDFWYKKLREYYEIKQIESISSDRVGWKDATINSLYYGLRENPLRTFQNDYLQWSELAIRGFEIDLDLQLRDELLSFLRNQNNRRGHQSFLSMEQVTLDSIVRWVKRYIFQAQYQQAICLAETILDDAPREYQVMAQSNSLKTNQLAGENDNKIRNALALADSFFWGHLLTYYGHALILAQASEVEITKILNKAIEISSAVDVSHDLPPQWLKARVLGHAYDRLGYLSRLNGHNGRAAQSYEQAISYFERAKMEDEYANTLNNLAYALALIGDLEQANLFINQALLLRQKIGQIYPIALSYNTRGLIQAMERPEEGIHDCRIASNKFEIIGADRGIGLACNALGYILRQIGNKWRTGKYSYDQAEKFYEEAVVFLMRAHEKFETIQEPSRLWEAYNEQGSLYNDWGLLLETEQNYYAAQHKYLLSEKYQLLALKLAEKNNMFLQQADSCDDLAKLYASRNMMPEAQKYLDACLKIIPPEYRSENNKKILNGEVYSLIAGKVHLQRGRWKINSSADEKLSSRQREKAVKDGLYQLVLAYYCFQKYWKKGRFLDVKVQEIIEIIRQSDLTLEETVIIISSIYKENKLTDGLLIAIERQKVK